MRFAFFIIYKYNKNRRESFVNRLIRRFIVLNSIKISFYLNPNRQPRNHKRSERSGMVAMQQMVASRTQTAEKCGSLLCISARLTIIEPQGAPESIRTEALNEKPRGKK